MMDDRMDVMTKILLDHPAGDGLELAAEEHERCIPFSLSCGVVPEEFSRDRTIKISEDNCIECSFCILTCMS